MEWAEADSPFDFQDFDLSKAADDFLFPVDDQEEFVLSSPNEDDVSSPEQVFDPNAIPSAETSQGHDSTQTDRTDSSVDPYSGQQSGRKQPSQSISSFNSYILSGMSPLSQPAPLPSEPGATHQKNTKDKVVERVGQTSVAEERRAVCQNPTSVSKAVLDLSKEDKTGAFHRRKGSTRKQPLTCSRCHSLKLKCDGEIPCWRCLRRGLEDQCCRQTSRRSVDAPVPWKRDGYVGFGAASGGVVVGPQRPRTVVEFMSGLAGKKMGINPSWIEAIVGNITPKLYQALTDTLGKLLATDLQLAALNPACMTKKASAKALDEYPSTPFMRQHFDWHNGVLDVEVNRMLAKFFGQHPEELLDRMSRNTIQPFFTEFDMLCASLDDLPLMMGGLPNGTTWSQRYHFGSNLDPKTNQYMVNVFRSTAKAVYDEGGRVKVIEKWMQPTTVEEYDIARERTPELCRPLQSAVGDRRSGGEIVHTHMHERYSESIISASFSSDMRRKLDALADAVRARYAPLVDHVVKKRRDYAAAKLASLPDP